MVLGLSRFAPRHRFHDVAGHKGIWRRVTRAQPHVIERHRVETPGWPPGLPPLRLVALSDLHAGSHADDLARYQAICQEVNALRPDLIVLLGDYVNTMPFFGGWIAPAAIAQALAGLHAPLGVHAVLGNHDWYYDGREVSEALDHAGISVLENAGVRLAHAGRSFWLAGLADDSTRTPDLPAALSGRADNEPAIIMSHDPACFAEVPHGPNIMLSGHLHGGQVVFPGIGALWTPGRAPKAWLHGKIDEAGRQLIVSAGLGTSGLPIRWNRPPEFLHIELAGSARTG